MAIVGRLCLATTFSLICPPPLCRRSVWCGVSRQRLPHVNHSGHQTVASSFSEMALNSCFPPGDAAVFPSAVRDRPNGISSGLSNGMRHLRPIGCPDTVRLAEGAKEPAIGGSLLRRHRQDDAGSLAEGRPNWVQRSPCLDARPLRRPAGRGQGASPQEAATDASHHDRQGCSQSLLSDFRTEADALDRRLTGRRIPAPPRRSASRDWLSRSSGSYNQRAWPDPSTPRRHGLLSPFIVCKGP